MKFKMIRLAKDKEDIIIHIHMTQLTEWVWVFLVFWIFVTVFGWFKKDEIVSAIGGILGIIFGIMYLSTDFMISLGMILLNFYLLYDSMGD